MSHPINQLFSSFNPANGKMIWQGNEASESDVQNAVTRGKEAFYNWSLLPIEKRIEFLFRFKELLFSSSLATTISQETGKPLWEAKIEVEAMIQKIPLSIDAYQSRCPTVIKEQLRGSSITRHRPHGVVAVLGPYNFPGHLPNGHIIPALLAGNTVVFKPSELTPLVAEETGTLWKKAGLPFGVLNIVQGGGEVGKMLVNHPHIQGVFFTGSYQTGLSLSRLFAEQPHKMLALEMGGNNPVVIGQISDIRAAAYAIIQSAYLTSGQRCTCARRLIIQNTNKHEELLRQLQTMISRIVVGAYDQIPEPFMGPIISETYAHRLLEAQNKLKMLGGVPLIEMLQLPQGKAFLSPGLIDVTPIKELPDEEIFGPLLQIIRVNHFEEAIEKANQTKYGLSAGLLSDQEEEYQIFFDRIQAGIINWNMPLTMASSAAPFGGIKCSGNNRPSAYYAADYCSYPTASSETPLLKMPERMFPGIYTGRD